MKTKVVSLEHLGAAIEEDIARLRARLERAVDETVKDSVGIVWERVPFAFGELHGSIHVEFTPGGGRVLVADAPHAAAVEVGSMPHMPPIRPLVAWCELRGFDDPERGAWAVATKISREGTKPTWYMRGSLPAIRAQLHRNIASALRAA